MAIIVEGKKLLAGHQKGGKPSGILLPKQSCDALLVNSSFATPTVPGRDDMVF